MSNPLDNTDLMSSVIVVPTTGTSSQPSVEPLIFQWISLNAFEGDSLLNLEPPQPVQVIQTPYDGEEVEPWIEVGQQVFMDIGGDVPGSEISVCEPSSPIKLTNLDNADRPELLFLLEDEHLAQFNDKGLDHSPDDHSAQFSDKGLGPFPDEEPCQFQAEANVPGSAVKELPPAILHKKSQPSRQKDVNNLSQNENKRLKKNEYSKWYRKNKKAEIQQLKQDNAFLRQRKATTDDMIRKLKLCDGQMDAEIQSLLAGQGGAGPGLIMTHL